MLLTYKQAKFIKMVNKLNRYKALIEQSAHLKNHNKGNNIFKATDKSLPEYLRSKKQ